MSHKDQLQREGKKETKNPLTYTQEKNKLETVFSVNYLLVLFSEHQSITILLVKLFHWSTLMNAFTFPTSEGSIQVLGVN